MVAGVQRARRFACRAAQYYDPVSERMAYGPQNTSKLANSLDSGLLVLTALSNGPPAWLEAL